MMTDDMIVTIDDGSAQWHVLFSGSQPIALIALDESIQPQQANRVPVL